MKHLTEKPKIALFAQTDFTSSRRRRRHRTCTCTRHGIALF